MSSGGGSIPLAKAKARKSRTRIGCPKWQIGKCGSALIVFPKRPNDPAHLPGSPTGTWRQERPYGRPRSGAAPLFGGAPRPAKGILAVASPSNKRRRKTRFPSGRKLGPKTLNTTAPPEEVV